MNPLRPPLPSPQKQSHSRSHQSTDTRSCATNNTGGHSSVVPPGEGEGQGEGQGQPAEVEFTAASASQEGQSPLHLPRPFPCPSPPHPLPSPPHPHPYSPTHPPSAALASTLETISTPVLTMTSVSGIQDGITVNICRLDVPAIVDSTKKANSPLKHGKKSDISRQPPKIQACDSMLNADEAVDESTCLSPRVVSLEDTVGVAFAEAEVEAGLMSHQRLSTASMVDLPSHQHQEVDFAEKQQRVAVDLMEAPEGVLPTSEDNGSDDNSKRDPDGGCNLEIALPEATTAQPTTLGQKLWCFLKHLGPAFVVSVAYIDPGNFATNISAGVAFNYSLIWVVLFSNLMAIFLQVLSAKVGIATGRNIPQLCSIHFSRRTNWVLWGVASVAAMATDLAEFLGAVLGFYLLCHIPKLAGAAITAVITLGLVALKGRGQRYIELCIGLLVAVVTVTYFIELFLCKAKWPEVFLHTVVPMLPRPVVTAVMISIGMLGATVMPHAIYLHSDLVQHRGTHDDSDLRKQQHLKMEKSEIGIAMNVAFIVNASMIIVSAATFYGSSSQNGEDITLEDAYHGLTPLLGSLASYAFGAALLAAGLSSSAVGTLAGEVVLNGFVNLKIPLLVRRIITMTPGVIIIAIGVDFMDALVISQVVLSFCLPGAILPLLFLTNNAEVMGPTFVNTRLTRWVGAFMAVIVISFNAFLLLAFVLQSANVSIG